MIEPVGPTHEEAGTAAAAALSPDPEIAELLKRKAAGEKLTQQQYGRLGWWQSKAGKVAAFLTGRANSDGGQAQSRPVPGNAAPLGPVASAQASANGVAPVQPDADMVKRVTAAVLTQADRIGRRYVSREARKTSASEKQISRLDSAAALPRDAQELMVEISPDALASLGLDARKYPLTVMGGIFGMWATNIWLALDEFRAEQAKERADRLQKENQRPSTPEKATENAT